MAGRSTRPAGRRVVDPAEDPVGEARRRIGRRTTPRADGRGPFRDAVPRRTWRAAPAEGRRGVPARSFRKRESALPGPVPARAGRCGRGALSLAAKVHLDRRVRAPPGGPRARPARRPVGRFAPRARRSVAVGGGRFHALARTSAPSRRRSESPSRWSATPRPASAGSAPTSSRSTTGARTPEPGILVVENQLQPQRPRPPRQADHRQADTASPDPARTAS